MVMSGADDSSNIANNTAHYGGGIKMMTPPDRTKLPKASVHHNVARMLGNDEYVEWQRVTLKLINVIANNFQILPESDSHREFIPYCHSPNSRSWPEYYIVSCRCWPKQ